MIGIGPGGGRLNWTMGDHRVKCSVRMEETILSNRDLQVRGEGEHEKKKKMVMTKQICTAQLTAPSQYTAAAKSSTLDPTAKALASLANLLAKDTKLGPILHAPTLSAEDKAAIISELTKQSGVNTPTVKNFLEALAENNRLGLLGDVCSKFSEIVAASRGEVEMKVTSAQVRLSLQASFFNTCAGYLSHPA